jgi:hypothetical protein
VNLAAAVQRKERQRAKRAQEWRADAQYEEWRRSPEGQLNAARQAEATAWNTEFWVKYMKQAFRVEAP